MMDKDFLKFLTPILSVTFPGALCVCWGYTFKPRQGHVPLCLKLHFLLMQVFPDHMHSPACVHGILYF